MTPKDQTPISTESLTDSIELASCLGDVRLAEWLFDLVSDIVFFVKDEKARYVLVNETLVSRSGLPSKDQILGKTSAEIFKEPLGDLFQEQDLLVLQQGEKIEGRIELHFYSDGSHGWCLTHKMPLFDQDRNIVGLAGISRDLHEPGQERSELGQAAKAVAKIKKDYSEPIRVADLAKTCGLTVSRFERIISKVYGMTPVQLLAKTRLDAATRLLENTEDSITDVAHSCGYTDHSAFSRQFRNSVGITPSEYRVRRK